MPFPSIEKACPGCRGNLHYEDSIPHPERSGYDIHTYKCLDCGPMVQVTQLADDSWPVRADLNKGSCGENSHC